MWKLVVILAFVRFVVSENLYVNTFDLVKGCKKYYAGENYYFLHEYIPTNSFQYTGRTTNSTFFRIGLMTRNDGLVRFSGKKYPYNDDWSHEIVISGWSNTMSEARRQKRNGAAIHNEVLKNVKTPKLLSEVDPIVIIFEFFDNGIVHLRKEEDAETFLEFVDTKYPIKFDYVGFGNWDCKAHYFFDCPLEGQPPVEYSQCPQNPFLTDMDVRLQDNE